LFLRLLHHHLGEHMCLELEPSRVGARSDMRGSELLKRPPPFEVGEPSPLEMERLASPLANPLHGPR